MTNPEMTAPPGPVGLLPRNCKLQPYVPQAVHELALKSEMIAYASPESTYAVTRRLVEEARNSILIGIYDFTAPYMRDLLVEAVGRGVKVEILLDLDNLKGEPEAWKELLQGGCIGIPAPSCASRFARYFSSCHEKVIVIDGEWTLVQSGNYTEASIPENVVDGGDPEAFRKGNRDMGVAIRSPELAGFFEAILRSDIALERNGELSGVRQPQAPFPMGAVPLPAAAPLRLPPQRFASRRFRPRGAVRVLPVLSPDNYMEIIPEWLAGAQQSIYIEQQYIRGEQPEIQKLLQAIHHSRRHNSRLNVRIILARPRGWNAREQRSLDALLAPPEPEDGTGAVLSGLQMGRHVRYLNPSHFHHCHNKLIVVDRSAVLVSSQNWSDSAVSKNREAGLLLEYAPVARYFAAIFNNDWKNGLRSFDRTPEPAGVPGPAEAPFPMDGGEGEELEPRLRASDYIEV